MEKKNKRVSIFSGVVDALNNNRRKKVDDNVANANITQVPPSINQAQDIETAQQQYLDWQYTKMAHDLYTRTVYYDTNRIGAYQDFTAMDGTPEIAAALDIIRDECLTRSERGNILEIYSENKRVKQVLNDLFKNVLNIDFNLRLWIRDLVKYGDFFVLLQIDKDAGIFDFMTLPIQEIHREDGHDGKTSSVRFRWETTGDYYEGWQVAHFRLLEDSNKIPYGRSLLDSSRKLWKQLQLAEDAMLVYRITRAPERRVFYIEVGNLEDGDVKQYMAKIQNQIRKQPIVDSKTGNMTQKYDPENVTEDYWIPIRGDKSSKIETLPGAANLGDIHDIEYLQSKLFAALKVPKTYLNFGESMPGGSTLSQADIRFSRTITSIQEAVLLELRRIANVHLYFLGFEDDLDNFHLTLTNPSTQQEILKLETMKTRLEVFKEFFNTESGAPTSYTWAMENILGFSKSDIKLILRQKKVEKKLFSEIESSVETYKKIGLFDDLDNRYEDPDALNNINNGEQSEGGDNDLPSGMSSGGGGFSGGGSFGGLSGMNNQMGNSEIGDEEGLGDNENTQGNGEDLENNANQEGGEEEDKTLKESIYVKKYKNSENRFSNLMKELLGEDEEKSDVKNKSNSLIRNNSIMNIKMKKLLESVDNNLNSVNLKQEDNNNKVEIVLENVNYNNENVLFENNERNNENIEKTFQELDKINKDELL